MVNNVGVNDASWVGVVFGMPRAGSYYNLGNLAGRTKSGRGPDLARGPCLAHGCFIACGTPFTMRKIEFLMHFSAKE